MSQWASVELLPAAEFERLRTNPDAPEVKGERLDLPREWYLFHELFGDDPGPLRYIVQGNVADRPIEPTLGLAEGRADDGDGTYFAYVSPGTVRAIDAALKNVPLSRVIGTCRQRRPNLVRLKPGRDAVSAAFEYLVRVYATAARRGDALAILIC